MKPGVTTKLFLALLSVGVLCAVAMGLATRYSFDRGFLGYLNELGVERLESMVPDVATAYVEHGSWDFLRGEPRAWFRLVRRAGSDGRAPGSFSETDLTGVGLRLALLDAQRRHIAGNVEAGEDAILRAVVVDGAAVGWLALIPFQHVSGAAHLRFREQQAATIWTIGALTVALAALVALLLARTLLSPLKRIAAATHRLAGGDYASRAGIASDDEIGRLANDFNRLAHTLEKNERMRREFMADVSHELRTPLAVLRAELEALADGVRPLNAEAVSGLQTSAETLGKLVDDLYQLSLSDVGALSYRKTEVEVCRLLGESLAGFEERFAAKRILVDAGLAAAGAIVVADTARLRQLFANLLENCLRHTADGGRLKVSCRIEDGALAIDLQDSAPGVSADQLGRLFERFYRAGDERSGAGLGLAICRNIVEAHEGSIRAQASPLGGLWIAIRLPLAAS